MTYSALTRLPLFEPISAVPESVNDGAVPSFVDLVQNFSEFGQPSVQVREGPIRYLISEFWTSGQRQAHSPTK